MLIRLIILIMLPLVIMVYGGVETHIHVPAYLLIGLMTLATLARQAKDRTFPRINRMVLGSLGLLLGIFTVQLLLGWFNTGISSGSLGQSPIPMHHPVLSLGSINIRQTWLSLSKGIFCAGWVYLFLCHFKTLDHKIQFLMVFCFGGFIISLFSILKVPMQNLDVLDYPYLKEGFGPFINKNHFAGYLETALSAGAGFIYLSGSKSRRILAVFFVVIMTIALLSSLSRMGVASLFIAVSITGLIFYRYKKINLNIKWILPAFIFLAGLLAWNGTEGMMDRYKSILNVSDTPHKFTRISYYKDALPMAVDFSVLGTGLGAFQTAFPEYKRSPHQAYVDYLHNDILQFLIEAGLPAFLLSLILAIYLATKLVKSIPAYNQRALCLSFAGITAGISLGIHSLFDFNLHIPSNALCFLAILFLPVSLETSLKVKSFTAWLIVVSAGLLLGLSGFQLYRELEYKNHLSGTSKEFSRKENIKILEELTEKFSGYSDAHYLLGKEKFYFALETSSIKPLEESILHFNRAISLNPHEAKNHLRAGIARYHYAVNREDIDHETVMSNALSDMETSVLKNKTSALMWYYYGYYSVKQWYDYSEVEDRTYYKGIKAWSRSIYLDPGFIPKVYHNLFEMFDDYQTLALPVHSIRSNEENRLHRIKSTGKLHMYLGIFLRKNIDEVKFPGSTDEDTRISLELFQQAEELYNRDEYLAAWQKFSEILNRNPGPEMLISTHRNIAGSIHNYLAQLPGIHQKNQEPGR